MRPQVLLSFASSSPSIAGLPVTLRAAWLFQGELAAERILIRAEEETPFSRWRARLRDLPWAAVLPGGRPLRALISADRPLLLLSPQVLPDAEGLKRFWEEARRHSDPMVLAREDHRLAAYHPNPRALLAALEPDADATPEAMLRLPCHRRLEAGESWRVIRDANDAATVEAGLFYSLPQDSDGYLARWDRRISMLLSKRLLALPISPNQITTASLIVGLAGAWLLTSYAYARQVAGATLLWLCCILDGCDGEVARLKLMSSPSGARYDLIADNVVHLAIFLALPIYMKHKNPFSDFWLPGAILLSGVLLSMFWVWRLILRSGSRGEMQRVFERIASRDFIYLVAALTFLHRLEWFLWASAVGSHIFWIFLVGAA